MDHTYYYQLVERAIAKLGVEVEPARGQKPGQWNLSKGSVNVWIDIWQIEQEENRAYFQVMSPVMDLPETNREALFRELLTINDQLFGVAFTLFEEKIWLKVIRECEGLNHEEALSMILRIGNYSDEYDDYLINKYGKTA